MRGPSLIGVMVGIVMVGTFEVRSLVAQEVSTVFEVDPVGIVLPADSPPEEPGTESTPLASWIPPIPSNQLPDPAYVPPVGPIPIVENVVLVPGPSGSIQ